MEQIHPLASSGEGFKVWKIWFGTLLALFEHFARNPKFIYRIKYVINESVKTKN